MPLACTSSSVRQRPAGILVARLPFSDVGNMTELAFSFITELCLAVCCYHCRSTVKLPRWAVEAAASGQSNHATKLLLTPRPETQTEFEQERTAAGPVPPEGLPV